MVGERQRMEALGIGLMALGALVALATLYPVFASTDANLIGPAGAALYRWGAAQIPAGKYCLTPPVGTAAVPSKQQLARVRVFTGLYRFSRSARSRSARRSPADARQPARTDRPGARSSLPPLRFRGRQAALGRLSIGTRHFGSNGALYGRRRAQSNRDRPAVINSSSVPGSGTTTTPPAGATTV